MQAQEDRRQQMLTLARDWRQSGMKGRAFAEAHGVTPWTLYYWRERLMEEERPARQQRRSRRAKLAPVHVVTNAELDGNDLEIILASGDRIRVAASVSPDRLRRVVEMLRTGC
jgi:transposase-like protein